jgi:catechol-2,3-dioxygenase
VWRASPPEPIGHIRARGSKSPQIETGYPEASMDSINPTDFRPDHVDPMRSDAPGTVKSMPSPTKLHHLHIFSDENYDKMVEFYQRLFAAEIVRVNPNGLTFITYDDHDHRVVIIKRPGAQKKPDNFIGVSHQAYCYSSLGELIYVYKRMKEWGYRPHWTVNHGNSTSFYYRDPDGNEVETMMDNYAPEVTKEYKRHYQWSEEFQSMGNPTFDADKMVELYESGVPDSVLLDHTEVCKMIREGKL